MTSLRLSRPGPKWRGYLLWAGLTLAILGTLAVKAPSLGLLGWQPIRIFPASGAAGRPRTAAVFLSGDMGFHFGLGAKVAESLADHGIPVIGVNTPASFASHLTRAQTDKVVIDALRLALATTGAQKLILAGQSYGADIVATTAPDLPLDLRSRIDAIELTVPATTVYFRADPSGIAYMGTPDARPTAAMRALNWAPVICIHGLAEKDSLCPALAGTRAQVIGLPGNHYLNRDPARLSATILDALGKAVPALAPRLSLPVT